MWVGLRRECPWRMPRSEEMRSVINVVTELVVSIGARGAQGQVSK